MLEDEHRLQALYGANPVNLAGDSAGGYVQLGSTSTNLPTGTATRIQARERIRFSVNSLLRDIIVGTGSPQGVVSAQAGSLYLDANGGSGSTLYVKEVGGGTSGWVAK